MKAAFFLIPDLKVVFNSVISILELADLPMRSALKVTEWIQKINEQSKVADATRVSLLRKYINFENDKPKYIPKALPEGEVLPEGVKPTMVLDFLDEFKVNGDALLNEKWVELLNSDIDVEKLPMSWFESSCKFKPSQTEILKNLLSDGSEGK